MDYKYYYGFLKKDNINRLEYFSSKYIETDDFLEALNFYNKFCDIWFEMAYKKIRKEEFGDNIEVEELKFPYIKRSDDAIYGGEMCGWIKIFK